MTKKLNILIVEDNKAHLSLITGAFAEFESTEGIELFVAMNLEDARSYIINYPLSLIIADAGLPDGRGTDLLSDRKLLKNVPIIILTNESSEDLAIYSLKKGAYDYFVKSYSLLKDMPRLSLKWIKEWQIVANKRRQDMEIVEKHVQLEESNKELHRIAYSISHDLATPIQGIVKLASWVEESIEDTNPEIHKNLSLLKKKALRLKSFMDGIVKYSNLNKKTAVEKVNVSSLLEDVIDSIDKPSEVTISIAPHPTEVACSYHLLFNLYQNLVDNAIKHNHGKDLEIGIEWQEKRDHHIFSVRDNGKGIDSIHQQKIFDIFQILEGRDETENIGVGLAISKKIVANFEGKIWAETNSDAGVSFKFTLPKNAKNHHMKESLELV